MSRDNRHIWRAGAVAVLLVAFFFVVRLLAVPDSWQELGPYRGDALREEAARKPLIPSASECAGCHAKAVEKQAAGSHAEVLCKNCHDVARQHIIVCTKAKTAGTADACVAPAAKVDDLKTGWDIDACRTCHQKRVGPPAGHPMIDVASHLDEMGADEPDSPTVCKQCHQPHSPADEPDESDESDESNDSGDGDSADEPTAATPTSATPGATDDDEEDDDE